MKELKQAFGVLKYGLLRGFNLFSFEGLKFPNNYKGFEDNSSYVQ